MTGRLGAENTPGLVPSYISSAQLARSRSTVANRNVPPLFIEA